MKYYFEVLDGSWSSDVNIERYCEIPKDITFI